MAKDRNSNGPVKRQIRWDYNIEPTLAEMGSEAIKLYVVTINDPRAIHRMRNRLRMRIGTPTEDFSIIREGLISGTRGLHYEVTSVFLHNVHPDRIEWDKVYNGRIVRDENLKSWKKTEELMDYVLRSIPSWLS